ncbi:hypothetical protein ACHAWF_002648 [Thalassiosira exigua]
MSTAGGGDRKRRKLAEVRRHRYRTRGSVRIGDLPDPLIANIGLYLAAPARALFAASTTAPSSSWEASGWKRRPNATSEAIASADPSRDSWKFLCLSDLGESLANKLTDGDLGAMLVCTNAKENLYHLRLTYCTNITGSGLAPLWGSTTLGHLDLTVKVNDVRDMIDKGPDFSIKPGALLCEPTVLRFLHGILDNADDFRLDSIYYPSWSGGESNGYKVFEKRFLKLIKKRWPCHLSDWEDDDASESSENSSDSS